jgi:2-dehydro-3-deoxyphosphogluconate aldolase / (4S)-4-hydroxy-2-oxoglutarate aldolase
MTSAIERFLHASPVVPVVVIDDAAHAVPLARALLDGGVGVIEVTLRTAAALQGIERIARDVPEMLLSAGTVTNAAQLQAAKDAGAIVAISPGITDALLAAVATVGLPLLPGIGTAGELMRGLDAGLSRFKLFPASVVGGVEAVKALGGPFPDVRFCPTGGVTRENAPAYLAQPNVACVGASWLGARADIVAQRWQDVTASARFASRLRRGGD